MAYAISCSIWAIRATEFRRARFRASVIVDGHRSWGYPAVDARIAVASLLEWVNVSEAEKKGVVSGCFNRGTVGVRKNGYAPTAGYEPTIGH